MMTRPADLDLAAVVSAFERLPSETDRLRFVAQALRVRLIDLSQWTGTPVHRVQRVLLGVLPPRPGELDRIRDDLLRGNR